MTQDQKPARHESEQGIAKRLRHGAGEVRAEAVALAHERGCRPESVGQLLMEGLESGGITCDELDEIVETLRSLNPGLAHAVMGGGRFDRQVRARSLAKQIQADCRGDVAGRLPESVLRPMEWALGADFGGVRVREGAEAEVLGAEAFARGEEIVFAPGRFEPGTVSGRELIGHELVHVMQQRAGRVVAEPERRGGPMGGGVFKDARLEAEADRLGGRAARGERTVVGWARGGEAAGGVAQLKGKEGKTAEEAKSDNGNDEKSMRRRYSYQVMFTTRGRPELVDGKGKSRREMVISLESALSDKAGTFVRDHTTTIVYDEGFDFAFVSVSGSDVDGLMLPVFIGGKALIGPIASQINSLIAKVKAENAAGAGKMVVGPEKVAAFVVQLEGAKSHLRELVTSRAWPVLSQDLEYAWYSSVGLKGKDLRPVVIQSGESDLDVQSKGEVPSGPSLPPKPAETPAGDDKKKDPETPTGDDKKKDPKTPPGDDKKKDPEAEVEPETPKATVTETNIEVSEQILFATDDDNPLAESRPSLDGVAKALNEHPEIAALAIEGHTDNTGDAEHNQNLSQRRAEKVRDHLRSKVERPKLRLVATGFGEFKPIANNKTKEGRARNRRVVFRIIKLEGASASTSGGENGSGGGAAAVQKRAARGQPEHARDVAEPGRVAQRGLEGEGDTFPFVEQIQEAFGGYDLASVRAHMDAQAIEAARELRAEAYASGEQVVFATAPDLHTAAHEAAHVVQQRAGVSLAGGVGQVGDRYEQHADQVADAVVSGRSAEGLLSRMAGGGVGRSAGSRGVQRVEATEPTKGEGRASSGVRPEGADEEYRKTVGDAYYAKTKTMSDVERTAFFKEEEYRLTVGDEYYEKTKGMSAGERTAFFREEEYRLTVGDEIYGETKGMSGNERTAYLKKYEAKLRGKLKPKRKPKRKDARKKLPPQIPGCEPSEPAMKGEGPGPWAMDDGWKGVPFKAPESGGECAAPGTSPDGAGQSSEGSGLVASTRPKGAGAPVQARAEEGRASLGTDDVAKTSQEGFAGAGGRLPFVERIQAAFGRHDIGGVRAHSDTPAIEAASQLGAEAYTSGEAVAFAQAPDLHTAAHEAAHVVQQRAGVSLAGGVGQVGDRYEQHADQVADAVLRGESAEGLLGQFAGAAGADTPTDTRSLVQKRRVVSGPVGVASGNGVAADASPSASSDATSNRGDRIDGGAAAGSRGSAGGVSKDAKHGGGELRAEEKVALSENQRFTVTVVDTAEGSELKAEGELLDPSKAKLEIPFHPAAWLELRASLRISGSGNRKRDGKASIKASVIGEVVALVRGGLKVANIYGGASLRVKPTPVSIVHDDKGWHVDPFAMTLEGDVRGGFELKPFGAKGALSAKLEWRSGAGELFILRFAHGKLEIEEGADLKRLGEVTDQLTNPVVDRLAGLPARGIVTVAELLDGVATAGATLGRAVVGSVLSRGLELRHDALWQATLLRTMLDGRSSGPGPNIPDEQARVAIEDLMGTLYTHFVEPGPDPTQPDKVDEGQLAAWYQRVTNTRVGQLPWAPEYLRGLGLPTARVELLGAMLPTDFMWALEREGLVRFSKNPNEEASRLATTVGSRPVPTPGR